MQGVCATLALAVLAQAATPPTATSSAIFNPTVPNLLVLIATGIVRAKVLQNYNRRL